MQNEKHYFGRYSPTRKNCTGHTNQQQKRRTGGGRWMVVWFLIYIFIPNAPFAHRRRCWWCQNAKCRVWLSWILCIPFRTICTTTKGRRRHRQTLFDNHLLLLSKIDFLFPFSLAPWPTHFTETRGGAVTAATNSRILMARGKMHSRITFRQGAPSVL